jgi:hypothetical protein
MKSRPFSLLFAAALFPSNAPLDKRLAVLSRHFEPKPGTLSEIDRATIRDKMVSAKHLGKFGGAIKVTPPKGSCFTITTSPERADVRVCRETQVKWSLDDIDLTTGTVAWKVRTGPDDFGTPIGWKVPYVIAKVLPPEAEFFKENSTPVYFKSCVATVGDKKLNPRKITLTKFDNSKWVIRFPDQDEQMKSLNESRPGEVWGDAYKAKKDDTQKSAAPVAADPHASPDAGGHGGEAPKEAPKDAGHGNANAGGHGAEAAAPPPEAPKEDLEPWTIDAGRTFEMSVENFITDSSMPPGRKGSCRYVFDHVPGNLERGRIECHDTGEYRYVYAFLPCMGALAPSEVRAAGKKSPGN